ncbi:hypothetical protein EDC04DRAFT_2753354 [Pisolithus marmoratus]|nr:hypothetical protein EDC04DRAFT_2753354 [Pisolithus marmoratus]
MVSLSHSFCDVCAAVLSALSMTAQSLTKIVCSTFIRLSSNHTILVGCPELYNPSKLCNSRYLSVRSVTMYKSVWLCTE